MTMVKYNWENIVALNHKGDRFMRKFMIFLSILTLCAVPQAAYAENVNTTKDGIELEPLGHGAYGHSLNEVKSGELIEAEPTEYDDIYRIDGEEYVIKVLDGEGGDNDVYQSVKKESYEPDETDELMDMLEENGYPKTYIDRVKRTIERQKDLGNDNLKVSVFMPEDPALTRSGDEETIYYEYSGYNFKDTITTYENCSSGMETIGEGEGTNNIIGKLIIFVFLGGSGFISPIFTGIISFYEIYKMFAGTALKGGQMDRISGNIVYDKYDKITAASGDSYTLGYCVSSKVYTDRIDIYEFFTETGKSVLEERRRGEIIFSDNFKNPAKKVLEEAPNLVYHDDELYTDIFRDGRFYY